jgi:hypothetical protein
MPNIKTLHNHNLIDLVSEEQLFEAADLNGIGITEALVPGVVLSIPQQIKSVDRKIVKGGKQRTLKAIPGQSWIDIALQEAGDESRIFDIIDLNGASITEDIDLSKILMVPAVEPEKQKIVSVLTSRNPSSMYYGTGDPAPEGIEFWIIETDFIVS